MGISERTFQRWRRSLDDRRPTTAWPVPKNKPSAEDGRYIASESTFYRVLRRSGEVTRLGRQQARQSKLLSTWQAAAPNQVWSSDITWLKSLIAGYWFYLYLIIEDVFSRKMVGYAVHLAKSGDNAAGLLQRTVLRERCWQEPLVLHADNGAPMKSQVL